VWRGRRLPQAAMGEVASFWRSMTAELGAAERTHAEELARLSCALERGVTAGRASKKQVRARPPRTAHALRARFASTGQGQWVVATPPQARSPPGDTPGRWAWMLGWRGVRRAGVAAGAQGWVAQSDVGCAAALRDVGSGRVGSLLRVPSPGLFAQSD
jgi:hypothetical protein